MWERAADGTLSDMQSYDTGGLGTGMGLGSQGAIAFSEDGRWLFAVNAGSNSVSVFEVRTHGLSLLHVYDVPGSMPISVASADSLVYVLNGASESIAGFRLGSHGDLSLIQGSVRGLGVAAPSSPEQIGFTPHGQFLVVTLKAANAIVTYHISGSGRPGGPKVNDSAVAAPYAFGFDDAGRLLVGNAANSSVASYDIAQNGKLVFEDLLGDGQKAACWVVVSSDGDYLYTANAGSGNISGFTVGSNGDLGLIDADGVTGVTGGKPLDLAMSSGDGYLYALNAGTQGINAFRVSSDGSLAAIEGATGLPAGATGLLAR
jgi:6-phosphogluconolactonase (cycloisomerase 2 family)